MADLDNFGVRKHEVTGKLSLTAENSTSPYCAASTLMTGSIKTKFMIQSFNTAADNITDTRKLVPVLPVQ